MQNALAMSHQELCETVIRLLARHTQRDPEGWTADSVLTEIGVDSFDFVEFVFVVEDEFGIEIDYNANDMAKTLSTIGAVADAIRRVSAEKAAKTVPAGATPLPA